MALEQRWRGDQRHFAAAEILRAHARHVARVELDFRVEPFRAVARVQQARADVDADLGVRFEEFGQPGQQEELRKRRRHRHVQSDARRGIGDQRVGLVDEAHRRADAFQVQGAGVGQSQAGGHALEQGGAQTVLQRGDVLADGALRQVQGFGGAAEIQGFGGGEENAQRGKGIAGAFHGGGRGVREGVMYFVIAHARVAWPCGFGWRPPRAEGCVAWGRARGIPSRQSRRPDTEERMFAYGVQAKGCLG
ncbi:hypothetical protein D3C72_1427270 [compost metagenome]